MMKIEMDEKTNSPENKEAINEWMMQNIIEILTEVRENRFALISHKGIVANADLRAWYEMDRTRRRTDDAEFPRLYFIGYDKFHDVQDEKDAFKQRLDAARTPDEVDAAFAPLRQMHPMLAYDLVQDTAKTLVDALYKPSPENLQKFRQAKSLLERGADLGSAFADKEQTALAKEAMAEFTVFSRIAYGVLEIRKNYEMQNRNPGMGDILSKYGAKLAELPDQDYLNPLRHAQARLELHEQLNPPPPPQPLNPFRKLKM